MPARLHLGFRPVNAASREHGVGELRRHGKAGHPYVVAGAADLFEWKKRNAQGKSHVFDGPCLDGGGDFAHFRFNTGGNRECGAIAAEDEREIAVAELVDDGGDNARPHHIDRLVLTAGYGAGRIDDIGDADDPVVGQLAIMLQIRHFAEVREGWNSGVKTVGQDLQHRQYILSQLRHDARRRYAVQSSCAPAWKDARGRLSCHTELNKRKPARDCSRAGELL